MSPTFNSFCQQLLASSVVSLMPLETLRLTHVVYGLCVRVCVRACVYVGVGVGVGVCVCVCVCALMLLFLFVMMSVAF